MRALESAEQVTQNHLNCRRFFQFFTGTFITGSLYLVTFQIISEHFQHTSQHTHPEVTAH
jgi:hypothetical protein